MTNQPKVVIPFRANPRDALIRSTLLDVVMGWWYMWGFEPIIQSDELPESEPFNRHRAFNLAVENNPDVDTFVFAEADMLIHPAQVSDAAALARNTKGLVIPFREYRSLSKETTKLVQDAYFDDDGTLSQWWGLPPTDPRSVFAIHPHAQLIDGEITGSVLAVSRETLNQIGGFTEMTSGVWYDDAITEKAIRFLTGVPTQWISGPAVHLYHPPLWSPMHQTPSDKVATLRNKALLAQVRSLIKVGDRERLSQIMQYRESTKEN